MARKKNNARADGRKGRALNDFFNDLFKDVDTSKDMRRLHEVFDSYVAKQGLSPEEADLLQEKFRLYVARNFARDILKSWPLTAAGRLKQIRELQEYKVKLVCKAFASSAPEAIFMYAPPHRGLDPKLIRSNLDAFVEWALSEPAGARKDNKVRDETIALMVSTILLNTKLRPTRNRASRGAAASACSIVVEILGEEGIYISEDLVESAWKTHAKDFDAVHDRWRPDLVRDPKPSAVGKIA